VFDLTQADLPEQLFFSYRAHFFTHPIRRTLAKAKYIDGTVGYIAGIIYNLTHNTP
jgi:hypothetical protein